MEENAEGLCPSARPVGRPRFSRRQCYGALFDLLEHLGQCSADGALVPERLPRRCGRRPGKRRTAGRAWPRPDSGSQGRFEQAVVRLLDLVGQVEAALGTGVRFRPSASLMKPGYIWVNSWCSPPMAADRLSLVDLMPCNTRRWLRAWTVSASAAARKRRAICFCPLPRPCSAKRDCSVGLAFAGKGLLQVVGCLSHHLPPLFWYPSNLEMLFAHGTCSITS